MSDVIRNKNRYSDDSRDISLIKRQTWLQNQVPWTRVIKKDKKWRKSKDRTFRPQNDIKIEPDPYQFKFIPRDISDTLKRKRENLCLSIQNLAFKSKVHIDKIIKFENTNVYPEHAREYHNLSNFELYKINYILGNYSSIKDIKNIKIPLPEGKLYNLSNL
jgi:hypothetical protein